MGRAAAAVAALFSLVALAVLSVAALLKISMGEVSDPQVTVPAFPSPQLEVDPQAELLAVKRREHNRLHESAAIPIDRAMEIIAQRGANAYDPLVPPASQSETSQ